MDDSGSLERSAGEVIAESGQLRKVEIFGRDLRFATVALCTLSTFSTTSTRFHWSAWNKRHALKARLLEERKLLDYGWESQSQIFATIDASLESSGGKQCAILEEGLTYSVLRTTCEVLLCSDALSFDFPSGARERKRR